MKHFVDRTFDILRKHRKTEPWYLVACRCCTITTCVLLLITYAIFLLIYLINDDPVERRVILPSPTIPAADLKFEWNFAFNIACKFVYLDGTRKNEQLCNSLIIQPKCCCEKYNNDTLYRGYFTAWNSTGYNFNYDLDTGLYGVWYTITLNDQAYNRDRDIGLVVRAYDSEFNPQTLSSHPNNTSKDIDSNFYNSIEELNHHVIGYRQNNWMFINRHLKKKLWPGGRNVIGIPPRHFGEHYITTEYESVNNPANNATNDSNFYGNLFTGTLNWYTEETTERRGRSLLDCLGLLAGFYALLVGIYVCFFGTAPLLPWGLCQTWFFRDKIRNDLRDQYPGGIPLVDAPNPETNCKERLSNLENFMKQYVIDVGYLDDNTDDEDENENDFGGPDEKNSLLIPHDASGGSGPTAGSSQQKSFAKIPKKSNNNDTPASLSENPFASVPPSASDHEVGGPRIPSAIKKQPTMPTNQPAPYNLPLTPQYSDDLSPFTPVGTVPIGNKNEPTSAPTGPGEAGPTGLGETRPTGNNKSNKPSPAGVPSNKSSSGGTAALIGGAAALGVVGGGILASKSSKNSSNNTTSSGATGGATVYESYNKSSASGGTGTAESDYEFNSYKSSSASGGGGIIGSAASTSASKNGAEIAGAAAIGAIGGALINSKTSKTVSGTSSGGSQIEAAIHGSHSGYKSSSASGGEGAGYGLTQTSSSTSGGGGAGYGLTQTSSSTSGGEGAGYGLTQTSSSTSGGEGAGYGLTQTSSSTSGGDGAAYESTYTSYNTAGGGGGFGGAAYKSTSYNTSSSSGGLGLAGAAAAGAIGGSLITHETSKTTNNSTGSGSVGVGSGGALESKTIYGMSEEERNLYLAQLNAQERTDLENEIDISNNIKRKTTKTTTTTYYDDDPNQPGPERVEVTETITHEEDEVVNTETEKTETVVADQRTLLVFHRPILRVLSLRIRPYIINSIIINNSNNIHSQSKENKDFEDSQSVAESVTQKGDTHQDQKAIGETALKKKYPKIVVLLARPIIRFLGYEKYGVALRVVEELYPLCAKQIMENKQFYIETCGLPETFQTWFCVTHLHVWMLMVRLRPEKDGKRLNQTLVNEFFMNAEWRIRHKYDVTTNRIVTGYLKDLRNQFAGGIAAYDEGFFKDDSILAAALWRNIFEAQGSAYKVALLVDYVRKTLYHLDQLPREEMNATNVQFFPKSDLRVEE
ncbi:hypothetical protein G9A89_019982 [Geosiphon pyriformis]|nr:hypothetical protein G9A89_019982 [Geosiphon pyriformis]